MKNQEQLKKELYAPLPADAIKPHPTKTFLSTIKPIYVTDRLNEVFGIGEWQIRTENVVIKDNGTVINKTILSIPKYNIYYECFGGNDNGGSSSKGFDLGDAFKGATTDAINKISSFLGIGIDVYRGKVNNNPPERTPKKEATPLNERQATALASLKEIILDTKSLIEFQANFKKSSAGVDFRSGATLEDVVKLNTIEIVGAFYKFVKG